MTNFKISDKLILAFIYVYTLKKIVSCHYIFCDPCFYTTVYCEHIFMSLRNILLLHF